MTTPATALNPAEVMVGTANGPGIWIANAGTAGPASVSAEWPTGWSILGYLSDDGPTVGQSTDTEDITPWQSIVPIRTIMTGRQVTVQFTLWQINARTMSLYFGSPVPEETDGAFDMQVRTDAPQRLYAIGIDSADADRVLRIVFPRCSLSDAGDMQIQRGAAIPLDVTLSALDYGGVLADVKVGRNPAFAPADLGLLTTGTNGHGPNPGNAGVQPVGGGVNPAASQQARRSAPRSPDGS